MEWISDWSDDELLVVHSKALHYLLNQLQSALAGGHLRATGVLALFYSAVLFTEGTGVYLQQRWAEVVILAVNCFIVWFLYLVLRRKPNHASARVKREVAHVS
jgi:hypothetical protein